MADASTNARRSNFNTHTNVLVVLNVVATKEPAEEEGWEDAIIAMIRMPFPSRLSHFAIALRHIPCVACFPPPWQHHCFACLCCSSFSRHCTVCLKALELVKACRQPYSQHPPIPLLIHRQKQAAQVACITGPERSQPTILTHHRRRQGLH
jgi:hypothetical protein